MKWVVLCLPLMDLSKTTLFILQLWTYDYSLHLMGISDHQHIGEDCIPESQARTWQYTIPSIACNNLWDVSYPPVTAALGLGQLKLQSRVTWPLHGAWGCPQAAFSCFRTMSLRVQSPEHTVNCEGWVRSAACSSRTVTLGSKWHKNIYTLTVGQSKALSAFYQCRPPFLPVHKPQH